MLTLSQRKHNTVWISSTVEHKKPTATGSYWRDVAFILRGMTPQLRRLVRARGLAENEKGRLLRERAGLSLRDVAAGIGTDVGTLSRWERGLSRPRPGHAAAWLRVYDQILTELGESSEPDRTATG